MIGLNTIGLALRAIRRNLLRSILTTLGIVIGVAAVVTMVTVGKGATRAVQAQIASLGSNLLMVRPGQRMGPGTGGAGAPAFKLADVQAVATQIGGVAAVAPEVRAAATAVVDNRNWATTVTGSSNDYFGVGNWKLAAGRLFEPQEEAAGAAVCVIGATVRRELFGAEDPLGRSVRIRRFGCTVVGLLQAKGQAQFVLVKTEAAAKPEAETKNQESGKNLAAGVEIVEVFSATHPQSDKWYNLNKAAFSWKLPLGAVASQTSLDRTEKTTPRVLRRPAVSIISTDGIKDGVWYFNSRFLVGNIWSKITAYKIQVDTAAPENLVITPAAESGSYPTISASDALSGIDYFMVQVDGAQGVKIVPQGNATEIKIPGILPGTHQITAYAYDLAGNSASTQAVVEFKRESGLSITNYSKEIVEGGRIEAEGVGPADSIINIQLVTEEGISRTYSVKASQSGAFAFRSEPLAGTGNYNIWAEIPGQNNLAKISSGHQVITVKKSVGSRIIQGIKSVSGWFNPTNIIILVLSFLCLLGWLNYFMLKKSIRPAAQRKNAKFSAKKPE